MPRQRSQPSERHLARTIFVSLPAQKRYTEYVEGPLSNAIERAFGRLQAVTYRVVRHGEWLPQIEGSIAYSNAVVAFLDGSNPNVLVEVGEAHALGKPLILVVQNARDLPSMIRHLQATEMKARTLGPSLTARIVDALDEAVFSVLHREHSDHRTKLQKRVLTGAPLRQTRNVTRATPRRKAIPSSKSLREAQRLHSSGDFRGAIAALDSCIASGFHEEVVFHLLSDTWFLDGESAVDTHDADESYDRMLEVAEEGLALHPESFDLRKDRALALLKKRRIHEAESAFFELQDESMGGVVNYNLACVAAQKQDLLGTIRYLRLAIRETPYYLGLARVDPDFDPVWSDPLFQATLFQEGRAAYREFST